MLGSYMDPDLYRTMILLQNSPFISHCAYLESGFKKDYSILWNFGANIVLTPSDKAKIDFNLFNREAMAPDIKQYVDEYVRNNMAILYRQLRQVGEKVARFHKIVPLPFEINMERLGWGTLLLRHPTGLA